MLKLIKPDCVRKEEKVLGEHGGWFGHGVLETDGIDDSLWGSDQGLLPKR